MDDVPYIDIMVDRALAIANLAATADGVADGDIRTVLLKTAETLLESIQPAKPQQQTASISRIK